MIMGARRISNKGRNRVMFLHVEDTLNNLLFASDGMNLDRAIAGLLARAKLAAEQAGEKGILLPETAKEVWI